MNNKAYPLVEATYTFLVFEAKTSKLVKRFDLPGRSGCPERLSYREGSEPRFLVREYDVFELEDILRPLVENRL